MHSGAVWCSSSRRHHSHVDSPSISPQDEAASTWSASVGFSPPNLLPFWVGWRGARVLDIRVRSGGTFPLSYFSFLFVFALFVGRVRLLNLFQTLYSVTLDVLCPSTTIIHPCQSPLTFRIRAVLMDTHLAPSSPRRHTPASHARW
ncbi:hypothetical protein BDZ89DRAFT_253328 [Hymenopellis radicata]|nr:hypothetical protein BDZ89DRAFT_253328 [Hymenopellis radicata]